MNRYTNLLIIAFLGLLVFLISDSSAACAPGPGCDCNDLGGCECSGHYGILCGSEIGCDEPYNRYQCAVNGDICNFGFSTICYKKSCSFIRSKLFLSLN